MIHLHLVAEVEGITKENLTTIYKLNAYRTDPNSVSYWKLWLAAQWERAFPVGI